MRAFGARAGYDARSSGATAIRVCGPTLSTRTGHSLGDIDGGEADAGAVHRTEKTSEGGTRSDESEAKRRAPVEAGRGTGPGPSCKPSIGSRPPPHDLTQALSDLAGDIRRRCARAPALTQASCGGRCRSKRGGRAAAAPPCAPPPARWGALRTARRSLPSTPRSRRCPPSGQGPG